MLNVDDEGIVTKAFYPNTTPVRGFETMLQGKPAAFGPIAVMRICGICQATHGIASAEAIEHAIDAEIPEDGKILRELLGLGVITSYSIHYTKLYEVGKEGKNVTYEKRPEFAVVARKNLELVNSVRKNQKIIGFEEELEEGEMEEKGLYNVIQKIGDITEKIEEENVDVIVLDMPDPWNVVPHAKKAIVMHGERYQALSLAMTIWKTLKIPALAPTNGSILPLFD